MDIFWVRGRRGKKTEGPGCRDLSVVQKKSVSAKGSNTSNLLLHLKVHLPQRHLEVKEANSKPSSKDKDYTKTGKASSRQP